MHLGGGNVAAGSVCLSVCLFPFLTEYRCGHIRPDGGRNNGAGLAAENMLLFVIVDAFSFYGCNWLKFAYSSVPACRCKIVFGRFRLQRASIAIRVAKR